MRDHEWEELAAEVAAMARDGVPPLIALSRLKFGKRLGPRAHVIGSAFDFYRGWIAWVYPMPEMEAYVLNVDAFQAGALARVILDVDPEPGELPETPIDRLYEAMKDQAARTIIAAHMADRIGEVVAMVDEIAESEPDPALAEEIGDGACSHVSAADDDAEDPDPAGAPC